MKTLQCTLTVTLKASPEAVFDLLTASKKIPLWCGGQKGGVQSKVGGKFSMFDGWVNGSVLAFERGKRLSYTWMPGDWPESTTPSIVTYAFSKSSKGTKIALVHFGFPNQKEMKGHKSGWTEYVFDPLKTFLSP